MIIRSHVAFGGGPLVFVGHDKPWRFKKGTQAFSRKLEKIVDIIYLKDDKDFFNWCENKKYSPVAIEICSQSIPLPNFNFPVQPALIVGSESSGLPEPFLSACTHVVSIPQFGNVGCLNVAVASSIALYELNRQNPDAKNVIGYSYEPNAINQFSL